VFRRLINDAKAAVVSVTLKYAARASVAVPFVIAIGFAIAAITAMLVQRFGSIAAYWMMAGGLAAIGIVAAVVVSVKEHEEEVAEEQAAKEETAAAATDAAAQALVQVPVALLGALMSMPGGASSAMRFARILGRNLPLVLLLVMIGALFWPTERADALDEEDIDGIRKPNGSDPDHVSPMRH
jgi:hypothetical protein